MYLHEQIIDEMLHLMARYELPMSKTEMVAEMAQAMHIMLTMSHGALTKTIFEKKMAEAKDVPPNTEISDAKK